MVPKGRIGTKVRIETGTIDRQVTYNESVGTDNSALCHVPIGGEQIVELFGSDRFRDSFHVEFSGNSASASRRAGRSISPRIVLVIFLGFIGWELELVLRHLTDTVSGLSCRYAAS